MKRAIIVHCWSGYPEYCWYPQTKKELEALGFEVIAPAMPETDEPKQSLWLPKLVEVIGEPDEDLYLIGHSIGSVTILRYLETLQTNQKIGGVVLVAGFTEKLPGYATIDNFFETPFEFEKIKAATNHFTFIHSDDDPFVPLRFGEELKEKLGGELIVKHAMGHFSGPVDETTSVTELPAVYDAIVSMSNAAQN